MHGRIVKILGTNHWCEADFFFHSLEYDSFILKREELSHQMDVTRGCRRGSIHEQVWRVVIRNPSYRACLQRLPTISRYVCYEDLHSGIAGGGGHWGKSPPPPPIIWVCFLCLLIGSEVKTFFVCLSAPGSGYLITFLPPQSRSCPRLVTPSSPKSRCRYCIATVPVLRGGGRMEANSPPPSCQQKLHLF